MGTKFFTNKDIAKITGLAQRSVQFYTSLIAPVKGTGEGKGNTRRYDREGLFKFFVVKSLSDYGITIAKIRTLLLLANLKKIRRFVDIGICIDADGFEIDLSGGDPDDRRVHLIVTNYINGDESLEVQYIQIGDSSKEVAELIFNVDLRKTSSFFAICLDLLYRKAMAA